MDNIRIWLIIAGVALLVGVFIWERRNSHSEVKTERVKDDDMQRLEEEARELGEMISSDIAAYDKPVEQTHQSSQENNQHEGNTPYVVLNVKTNGPWRFQGQDIMRVMMDQGLTFSDKGCFEFHLSAQNSATPAVFQVLNMLNPGTFPDENLKDFSTIGLTFLLVFPTPIEGSKAFDRMLDVARNVAYELNGQLLDQSRSTLTKQGIQLIKDKIVEAEYQYKNA